MLLGLFMILPATGSIAYAEDSWTVSVKPYHEFGENELFQPRELPIISGDSVIWKNMDSTSHKIASGVPQHPDYSGEFFSTNIISPGEDHTISLDFEGYAGYYYFCEIHPWFTGKIFFEERPGMYNSTLDTSYEILDENKLSVGGIVESDLGNTEYEMLIFDSKNNVVYQKIQSFEPDASFNQIIDISESLWNKNEKYTLKLVFGVPSESTSIPIIIPIDQTYEKSKYLEFCQDFRTETNFLFEEIYLPNWYKKSLCWYGNELMTEKELSDSLNYLENL